MKITFPPDDPSECGGWRNSRVYEALPNIFPVVTYLIMTWCIGNHLVGYIQSQGDPLEFYRIQARFGAMNPLDPWGEPLWKHITSCFIHDSHSILHLLFNMMWLYMLGPLMERGIGSWKFLLFVLITGFTSSALQTSFEGAGVGFSGVVYAMAGFMWAAWPRWTGFIEKFRGQHVKFMLFWQVICFLVPAMRIANTAHVSGMIIGGTIGLWACWGSRKGLKWLIVSCAIVGLAITVAFWSPWSDFYKLHQLSKKENPTQEERLIVEIWRESQRDMYEY